MTTEHAFCPCDRWFDLERSVHDRLVDTLQYGGIVNLHWLVDDLNECFDGDRSNELFTKTGGGLGTGNLEDLLLFSRAHSWSHPMEVAEVVDFIAAAYRNREIRRAYETRDRQQGVTPLLMVEEVGAVA